MMAFASSTPCVRCKASWTSNVLSQRPQVLSYPSSRKVVSFRRDVVRSASGGSPGPSGEGGSGSLSAVANAKALFREKILLGFEPTPELSAIFTVYFVQGALGISRLALTFFFKDDLSLGPAEVASLTAITTFPWVIKPLYGILTDSLPLFGYRRRSYLISAGLAGAVSWICLGTVVHSTTAAIAAAVLSSASVAISDVVADSLVVERVRDQPASQSGALQSLCWGSSAIGGLLSAYFSGSLLEVLSAREIFIGTALLPLLTASLAGLITEKRTELTGFQEFREVFQDRTRELWGALRNRAVYLPVLFVFLWQATPSPDSAMFFFNTNVLGFGPEFLGRVRLASAGAALVGLWSYQRFFRHLDIKTIMIGANLVSVPLALTQLLLVTRANVALGISDQLFALTDTAVLAALGQVAFMPTLVLAARLCPPGVEGTLFAALMSIYNASGVTSNQLGAVLTGYLGITETDYTNLWLLVTICALSSLLILPLGSLLDAAPPAGPEEDDDEDGDTPGKVLAQGPVAVASDGSSVNANPQTGDGKQPGDRR